jgi:hypothetical protein
VPAAERRVVRVEGLRELNRAFKVADKSLAKEYRAALREVGKPVQEGAERLVHATMPRVRPPWSQMRVGITQKVVYVAPKARGTRAERRRRPKFGTKLLEQAMVPALNQNIDKAERRFEQMLAEVGKDWERA